MSKYTPGPWCLDDPDMGHVLTEEYHSIKGGCGFLPDDGREKGFGICGFMSAADARLIAAAPELLDALIALVDAHAVPSSTCKERPAYEAALAAIAKATGDGYQGVRCQCIVTGCRPGPGCPIYSKTQCEAHMAFDRIAKATGEPT